MELTPIEYRNLRDEAGVEDWNRGFGRREDDVEFMPEPEEERSFDAELARARHHYEAEREEGGSRG